MHGECGADRCRRDLDGRSGRTRREEAFSRKENQVKENRS